MRIVKVNATGSTNSYLREYSRSLGKHEDILLWTEVQEEGRGQRGAFWESEPYKNLTFSIFKKAKGYRASQQFYITMAASLAVVDFLRGLGVKRLSIKWPNDIMAGSQKICGILIESVIKQNQLDAVIIGVGINVNQTVFNRAPRATSVMLETDMCNDLQHILQRIPPLLKKYEDYITSGDLDALKISYEKLLFRRALPSVFEDDQGDFFMAIIEGVSPQGLLLLKNEDEVTLSYHLKEVKLHY